MKYLKTYEENSNSIYQKDGKTVVNVIDLGNDMLDNINTNNRKLLVKTEDEYKQKIRDLLVGKVISFYDSNDDENIKGICKEIDFENDVFEDKPINTFQIDALLIYMENSDEGIYFTDELITIENEEPELFRTTNKYNL